MDQHVVDWEALPNPSQPTRTNGQVRDVIRSVYADEEYRRTGVRHPPADRNSPAWIPTPETRWGREELARLEQVRLFQLEQQRADRQYAVIKWLLISVGLAAFIWYGSQPRTERRPNQSSSPFVYCMNLTQFREQEECLSRHGLSKEIEPPRKEGEDEQWPAYRR
jgi:hypothetical protein